MFTGFEGPEENWSKLPHQLINALPLIETVAELKVILYILRHTWGYHETEKRISLEEFSNGRKRKKDGRIDGGTGLTIPAIRDGLKRAVKHGFVTVETDDSDKARVKKFYSLTQTVKVLQPECKTFTAGVQNSCSRSEKDTFEGNSQEETLIAGEAPAPASTPSDLEQETPAQADNLPQEDLPQENVEQEYPPVAISADCKDSIATLFDADPPAHIAPDPPPAKPRQPNARQQAQAALEEHFHAKTKLPLPPRKNAGQIKAASRLWWTPLADIWQLCDQDTARAKKLIDITIDHLRTGKMTVANPNSILKTAGAILTGNVPGVKMPHEKKLQKITLIHSDGTLEEVEEFV